MHLYKTAPFTCRINELRHVKMYNSTVHVQPHDTGLDSSQRHIACVRRPDEDRLALSYRVAAILDKRSESCRSAPWSWRISRNGWWQPEFTSRFSGFPYAADLEDRSSEQELGVHTDAGVTPSYLQWSTSIDSFSWEFASCCWRIWIDWPLPALVEPHNPLPASVEEPCCPSWGSKLTSKIGVCAMILEYVKKYLITT